MARYRVGDKYLSEDEYEEHLSSNWKFGLFVIGAVFVGYFTNLFLLDFGLVKGIRFTLVLIVAIPAGYFFSKLSNFIRVLFGLTILVFFGWLVFAFIWNLV